jgi:hypothetical protein
MNESEFILRVYREGAWRLDSKERLAMHAIRQFVLPLQQQVCGFVRQSVACQWLWLVALYMWLDVCEWGVLGVCWGVFGGKGAG